MYPSAISSATKYNEMLFDEWFWMYKKPSSAYDIFVVPDEDFPRYEIILKRFLKKIRKFSCLISKKTCKVDVDPQSFVLYQT